MLQNSVTKIFVHNPNFASLIANFGGQFSFESIVEMPDDVKKLCQLESDILARMHPNQSIPLYFFLSEKFAIAPHDFMSNTDKHKYFSYFDFEPEFLEDHFFKLEDDLQVSMPHMLPQDIQIIFDYGQAIATVIDNHSVSTSREWRKQFWHSRYDAFDSSIENNRIQFKTCGSAPFKLLEKWISENKLTCDIGNVQDDFEYWSFSSYKDGELVTFEDTLDSCLLKVLMLIEEEKPNAQTFKRIYRDTMDKNIPRHLLATYLNGEAYPHV